jgi:hypothetical protein
LLREEPDILGCEGALLGNRFRSRKLNEHLIFAYRLAFLDKERADHATIPVLDRLALPRHRDAAFRVGRGIERRKCCPTKKPHEKQGCYDYPKPYFRGGIVYCEWIIALREVQLGHCLLRCQG